MADGYYQDNYWAAFAFRKTNYSDWYSTSGYMVYYRYDGRIELYSASGGVLKTSNTGKNLSTWRHVKIVASGSNIKVYVDGNLEIDHSDGTYTGGYFGLNVFGVSARHDNLTILSNTEVHYVRDVDGSVLAEYDISGNLLAEYVYANGQRIARVDSSGDVHVYLNDHLGSARAMLGTGWSANYYPYGEIASQSGAVSDTRFDFTGHERDQGTGLVYAGARLLEPEIGRWLSVDPLVEKYPAWSPYNYALDNPINAFDPDGRIVITIQVAARGQFGITSSLTFGIAVDSKLNIGLFTSFTAGLGPGVGVAAGFEASLLPAPKATIDDLQGPGFNIGGYAGLGTVASADLNFSLLGNESEINDFRIGGTASALSGIGVGFGLFGEVSLTGFLARGNILNGLKDFLSNDAVKNFLRDNNISEDEFIKIIEKIQQKLEELHEQEKENEEKQDEENK